MNYIYRIYHKYIKKCYIGQTTNPTRRFKQHMQALYLKKHANPHMQRTFNKWRKGWQFEVIDMEEDYFMANLLELTYIHRDGFYNAEPGKIWTKYGTKHLRKDKKKRRKKNGQKKL